MLSSSELNETPTRVTALSYDITETPFSEGLQENLISTSLQLTHSKSVEWKVSPSHLQAAPPYYVWDRKWSDISENITCTTTCNIDDYENDFQNLSPDFIYSNVPFHPQVVTEPST